LRYYEPIGIELLNSSSCRLLGTLE